jgi:PAS domain S-box-containing protein
MSAEPTPSRNVHFLQNSLSLQFKDNDRVFELLVQSVRDYGIFMLDKYGYVMTWNEGAERMEGYTSEEILGQHFSKFYTTEARASKHPQYELDMATREGRYEEEGWRVRKDGTMFWANVVITAVYDESDLVGFAKVTRDLTERKRAWEAHRDAEKIRKHLELMINSVRDYAIFLLDATGHVVTWNEGAERIKGYRADEIIGKHFSEFYTPEAKAIGHPQHELEIAKKVGKYEEEGWRVRKDGTLLWANVLITALFENGELIGFSKVTRDLTERKATEKAKDRAFEQASKANEELQHLAYTVSHELQEPISSVISYSKLLSSRYTGRLGSDADEFLMRIKSGAKMTARLVDDLWTYARVARPNTQQVEVSTEKVCEQALFELERLIAHRNAIVEIPDASEFPTVMGVRDHILYVFKELMANALKHYRGPDQPRLTVTIEAERGGWTFNFKDNGPGIDKFFAQQVFSLYQRLNRKPDDTGTGMGLPICKKIVEDQHEGHIGFESIEGQGAKFFFWLPDKTA